MPFIPLFTFTSVASVGERGPGVWKHPEPHLLQMTFWLLEGREDMTFDKPNMTERGAHGLMLVIKWKEKKRG